MLRLEINALQHARRFIIEAEEDIKTADLIGKIGLILKEDKSGILISCDKEGVLPYDETLSKLSIASGELLVYLKGSG